MATTIHSQDTESGRFASLEGDILGENVFLSTRGIPSTTSRVGQEMIKNSIGDY